MICGEKDLISKQKRNLASFREPSTQKLAKQILIEARKIARLELQTLAEQILTDAVSVGRWEKEPFYIA